MTKRPEAPAATWWSRLWQPFWALPATIAALSLVLGVALPELDRLVGDSAWVFQGGTSGARSLLGSIAGAMISVTGLVFSITMVILQLASSQFSPRVLGSFLESRVTQTTLGVFTGSFLYALTVLRSVRGDRETDVPQIAVTVSYVYVVVAVGMFLAFIHHITRSVQVSQVMRQVRTRTVRVIRRLHGGDDGPSRTWSPRPDTPWTVLGVGDGSGYVVALDGERLVQRAAELSVVAVLDVSPGDHLVPGQHIGRAWGRDDLDDDEVAALVAALHLGEERGFVSDVAFGVRQLVDIAERALSPGINDPTTAVQSINELHVVLRELAGYADPSPYLADDGGTVRAIYRPQSYGGILRDVVAELGHYGSDSLRVPPHLVAMLEDLRTAALPQHAAATAAVLAELRAGIETSQGR